MFSNFLLKFGIPRCCCQNKIFRQRWTKPLCFVKFSLYILYIKGICLLALRPSVFSVEMDWFTIYINAILRLTRTTIAYDRQTSPDPLEYIGTNIFKFFPRTGTW